MTGWSKVEDAFGCMETPACPGKPGINRDGVYFYRIEVTDSESNKVFSETKSMIYLK